MVQGLLFSSPRRCCGRPRTVASGLQPMVLEYLFVFDPRLGGEETAERKVLWFHPAHTPAAARCNAVGLVEALGAMACTLGATGPCELLVTARRRHVILRPEPDMWLVAVHVLAPQPRSAAAAAATGSSSAAAADCGSDAPLRAGLRRFYDALVLSCGPLCAIRDRAGVHPGPRRVPAEAGAEALRSVLRRVAPVALRALNLRADAEIYAAGGPAPSAGGGDACGSGSGLGSCDRDVPAAWELWSLLDGNSTLPPGHDSPHAQLRIACAAQTLLFCHPCVRHVVLAGSGRARGEAGGEWAGQPVLWSSLDAASSRGLYRLLNGLARPLPPPPPDTTRHSGQRGRHWGGGGAPSSSSGVAEHGAAEAAGSAGLSGTGGAGQGGCGGTAGQEGTTGQEVVACGTARGAGGDGDEEAFALELLLRALAGGPHAQAPEVGYIIGAGVAGCDCGAGGGSGGGSAVRVPRLWLQASAMGGAGAGVRREDASLGGGGGAGGCGSEVAARTAPGAAASLADHSAASSLASNAVATLSLGSGGAVASAGTDRMPPAGTAHTQATQVGANVEAAEAEAAEWKTETEAAEAEAAETEAAAVVASVVSATVQAVVEAAMQAAGRPTDGTADIAGVGEGASLAGAAAVEAASAAVTLMGGLVEVPIPESTPIPGSPSPCAPDAGDGKSEAASAPVGSDRVSTAPPAAATPSFAAFAPAAPATPAPAGGWCCLRLVLFRSHGVCAALLVDEAAPQWQDPDWYSSTAGWLAPELEKISAALAPHARRTDTAEPLRYFYVDGAGALSAPGSAMGGRLTDGRAVGRLAGKLGVSLGGTGRASLPPGLTQLMLSAHHDLGLEAPLAASPAIPNLTPPAEPVRQISARVADGWLLARSSGARRLYAVVESRHASQAEAEQELLGLVATRFSHTFLDVVS